MAKKKTVVDGKRGPRGRLRPEFTEMKPSGSTFRATQDSTGKTIIARTRSLKGQENLFVFSSSAEMKAVLDPDYDKAKVDSLLRELAEVGSAHFTVSKTAPDGGHQSKEEAYGLEKEDSGEEDFTEAP